MSSSTGGYLLLVPEALPNGLTLVQFIQQLIVGITGLNGSLVREKYQTNAPKIEEVEINWCSFSLSTLQKDYDGFIKQNQSGDNSEVTRHQKLIVSASFYGPNSNQIASQFCNGFLLSQNREVLRSGNLNFNGTSDVTFVPEKKNEQWFKRHDVTLTLTQKEVNTTAVQSLESYSGTIKAQQGDTENIIEESIN